MTILQTGTIGTLPIHENKARDGYHCPAYIVKEATGPGLMGDLDLWAGYKPDPTYLKTQTLCIQDDTAITYRDLVYSMVGNIYQLNCNNGMSANASYLAKVSKITRCTFDAVCPDDDDDGFNQVMTVEWVLKLYPNNGSVS